MNNPNDDSEFLIVCMGLLERKKLQREISIPESSLSKILQHQSMSMYNETDFKIEYELMQDSSGSSGTSWMGQFTVAYQAWRETLQEHLLKFMEVQTTCKVNHRVM